MAADIAGPRLGAELVLDLLVAEACNRGYMVDEEAEQYRRIVIAALEKLGIRRYREATELAYATAWLIDGKCRVNDGRGADLRALAAAAVYWAWLVERGRGLLPEKPSAQRAWELAGSSRSSFYRAIRIWATCLLGMEDHRPLLRGEARVALHSSRVASYPGSFIVALRGYVPAAAGAHRLRLSRLAPVELLLLPLEYTRRSRAMNGRVTVTFDYEELYELIRRNFDYEPFTTSQFAKLLALHFPSASQLLKRLENIGMVERLRDGLWRLREKHRAEPPYPA